jgi:hypothetical protein
MDIAVGSSIENKHDRLTHISINTNPDNQDSYLLGIGRGSYTLSDPTLSKNFSTYNADKVIDYIEKQICRNDHMKKSFLQLIFGD